MHKITRREMIRLSSAASLGLAVAGCAAPWRRESTGDETGSNVDAITFDNADFYAKDGRFLEARANEAYLALMQYHGFPVFDSVRQHLWVTDYGAGEFARLGMGVNMYLNVESSEEGDRYMLMDVFLLPNQMLPEHYHVQTDKARPKRESWLVRHGATFIISEGATTPGIEDMIPESQRASATVFHAQLTKAGQFASLNRATAPHAQIAGPEGCIMTEVANFHDNDGVRHTNPALRFP